MTKTRMTKADMLIAALTVGILTPAGAGSAWAQGGEASLSAALAAAQAVAAPGIDRERRRLKAPWELVREADLEDYWASRPSKPPTEKEICEAGGHHLFVVSPKTGRKYCIPAFTDRGGGERGGGERPKTQWEIDREIEANDSFPEPKPLTEKEYCELGGHHVFVVSPKTGRKYCLPKFTDRGGGERGGGEREKTQWEIDREVEANDSFPDLPPLTPEQECKRQAPEKAWVKSSKGNFYCLNAYEND